MPLMFVAFGAEFINHGSVVDGLGIAGVTLIFVAVMVWVLRDMAERVEVTESS